MTEFHDDLPIKHPDHDEFGYGAFAKAIADCIRGIKHPSGSAVAIHGPWGSGKSSLVHLVLHELENRSDEASSKDPIVISFNSWCYRHEEGIVNGFFQALQLGLPRMGEKNWRYNHIKNLLEHLAFSVGSAFAVEQGVDPVVVEIVGSTAKRHHDAQQAQKKKYVKKNKTIEELQKEIGENLKERVLVVIDDIDRLAPEEAMAVFRLIKSVGRIRNVMYLLSYDRKVAEGHIKSKYSSEGDHYLEKIVQANFDMPEPSNQVLEKIVDQRLSEILQEAAQSDILFDSQRVRNIVRDAVIPEVKNIRDIHRLFNMLSVTYNSVAGDVDMADFIALETLRFFQLDAYQAIRSRKSVLTESRKFGDQEELNARIENEIISKMNDDKSQDEDKVRLRSLLASIFPPINPYHADYIDRDVHNWRIEKRACSELHFDTYFRFSVSDEVVSESEFRELVKNAHDQDFVKQTMLNLLSIVTTHQRSKASYMLDMLAQRSELIKNRDISNLLFAIYSVANELQKKFDLDMDFGYSVSNRTRIRWLSEKLFSMRFSVNEVSRMMLEICEDAPLNLQIEYCGVSLDHYYWNEGSVPRQQWVPFTKEDTDKFRRSLSKRISGIYQRIGEDDYEDVIFRYGNYVQIISDMHVILNDKDKVESLFECMLDISDENVLLVAKEFDHSSPEDIVELIDAKLFMFKFHDLESRISDDEDRNALRRVIRKFEECNERWYEDE